jgi:DNA-binding GntR family transcriptional regulator
MPLPRVVLREQVKDVLLERVVSGEYPPGSRLVETRIAQELGVSQAPVREALRDLEQLGLVKSEPFRGCSVRELSLDELLEAFPVRSALETLAARLAAAAITEAELARLDELIEAMRAATDPHAASTADAAFHETIVEAARNATLTQSWQRLQPFARTYISLILPASRLGSLADRHKPILAALRRRDPEAAAAAMAEHLADAADRLRPQLVVEGDTA